MVIRHLLLGCLLLLLIPAVVNLFATELTWAGNGGLQLAQTANDTRLKTHVNPSAVKTKRLAEGNFNL